MEALDLTDITWYQSSNAKIIIPNGTTYNIKSITIKYLEETLIVTTIEDKIFTYDINDIRNIITHDNIYTLDFLDNDDLSFESNVEPDDLRITSISFENKDLFIEFVNNLIRVSGTNNVAIKKKPETATTYFKTSPADVRNPSKSFFP